MRRSTQGGRWMTVGLVMMGVVPRAGPARAAPLAGLDRYLDSSMRAKRCGNPRP